MKVYIAAPYTQGDVAINVHRVIRVADELLEMGHSPFIPHLTHFWHLITPQPWSTWLRLDLEFLAVCDCVLRLYGNSIGADAEVEEAERLGIPVYYSIEGIQRNEGGKE